MLCDRMLQGQEWPTYTFPFLLNSLYVICCIGSLILGVYCYLSRSSVRSVDDERASEIHTKGELGASSIIKGYLRRGAVSR